MVRGAGAARTSSSLLLYVVNREPDREQKPARYRYTTHLIMSQTRQNPMLGAFMTEEDWVDAQFGTTNALLDSSGGVWTWPDTSSSCHTAAFQGFDGGISPIALSTGHEAYLEPSGYPAAFAAGSPGMSS